ncbi:MAG: hypothetical protein ABEJ76_04480 [Halanaeroarchaeum sp.]
MSALAETLRLAGAAVGSVGAILLFVEFFQVPSYVNYDTDFESYSIEISPSEAAEYTWFGRIGALAVALAFAMQFVAGFLG